MSLKSCRLTWHNRSTPGTESLDWGIDCLKFEICATPVKEVEYLRSLASPGSELIVVPDATHEALTYYFSELAPAVLSWLAEDIGTTCIKHAPGCNRK